MTALTPIAILILSISMSADAFAAAIGRGAAHRPTLPQALRSGLIFGIIEAITPLIGFALGIAAAGFVEAIDHWIAFGLLGAVGAKMIWEALKPSEDDDANEDAAPARAARTGLIALIATAIGTSIDAGAIGVGLALLGENIWLIAACIGLTTFVFATMGLLIGKAVGTRFGKIVELVGGVALIALGVKILLEHLGIIGG